MNKKQMISMFLKILYNAHLNEDTYPAEEINNFEKEIGSQALHEIILHLREIGWTKLNSSMGIQGDIVIVVGRPLLTLDAIDYLQRPFWLKLNWKLILWGISASIGAIWAVITQFLPNMNKILDSLNYIKNLF